jgi:hypothetical protein
MKFKQTRKAIKNIRGTKLQKDFKDSVTRIERSKGDNKAVGHQVSHLIAMTLELRSTLSSKTRFAIADALFADADEARLVNEWERKVGFECGSDNLCSKPNEDKTCYRDTNSSACVSG